MRFLLSKAFLYPPPPRGTRNQHYVEGWIHMITNRGNSSIRRSVYDFFQPVRLLSAVAKCTLIKTLLELFAAVLDCLKK